MVAVAVCIVTIVFQSTPDHLWLFSSRFLMQWTKDLKVTHIQNIQQWFPSLVFMHRTFCAVSECLYSIMYCRCWKILIIANSHQYSQYSPESNQGNIGGFELWHSHWVYVMTIWFYIEFWANSKTYLFQDQKLRVAPQAPSSDNDFFFTFFRKIKVFWKCGL